MPYQDLYLIKGPERQLVVVSQLNGLALFLRHVPSDTPSVAISMSRVENTELYRATKLGRIHGCLGLLHDGQDIFLAVVDGAASVNSLRDASQNISRILSVQFHCLSASTYDAGPSGDPGSYDTEDPCSNVSKILTNGNFYFSNVDLSTRLEVRVKRGNNDAGYYDERFLWNSFMLDSLLGFRAALTRHEKADFDEAAFLVMTIQGYCGAYDINMGGTSGPATVTISVISRLGWHRAGTRFNARGVDDDGHVANFVETETIFKTHTLCLSYVQLRGSIPLFWEQNSVQPFATKVTLTRPAIASQPAFDKHLQDLLGHYPRIHILNLLGTRDHESLLTQAYESHLRTSISTDTTVAQNVAMSNFDFHARARLSGIETVPDQLRREERLVDTADKFHYCLVGMDGEKGEVQELLSTQTGVFRTNCLDCLDRTNVIQDVLSRITLESFVHNLDVNWSSTDFLWNRHSVLWAENGDALAKIYAGTGALNTSFTRSGKRTLAGVFSDATKSVSRLYQSNFADSGKQLAIDELLGNMNGQQKVVVFDPIHASVQSALTERESEYSSFTSATIWVGTFNLNGRAPGSESILPWLFPDPDLEPDILAVGFQELVQLTAGQIVATDPEKRRRWEQHINQILASRPDTKASYVVLRSEQLVGAVLILIVKTSIVHQIRNVEAATKKTGLKGMAGNKGGIAIRLDYKDSSFCFVTAHFAAGNSNVEERDRDYSTITRGITFRRGLTIDSHDNVIWFGDFNYRVSMASPEARSFAASEDFLELLESDQLENSMRAGRAFAGLQEAPITFPPTYKYDTGTDVYDSSEKQRTPSWTDRILYRGHGLDISRYARAEIKLSDHRPVYAIARAQVKTVDKAAMDKIAEEILTEVRAKADQGLLRPKPETFPSLPDPSDDNHAWWITPDEPQGLVSDDKYWNAPADDNQNPFDPPVIKRKPSPSPSL